MTYEIKTAIPEDAPWIVEVAGKDMIENAMGRPELYNVKVLDQLADKVIDQETGLICWKGEERVGMLGGILVPHFLNNNLKILFEVVWFVQEEHRGTTAPSRLIKAYKKLIDEKADEGVFTLLGTTPVKDSSLARLGFKLQEKHYTYRK